MVNATIDIDPKKDHWKRQRTTSPQHNIPQPHTGELLNWANQLHAAATDISGSKDVRSEALESESLSAIHTYRGDEPSEPVTYEEKEVLVDNGASSSTASRPANGQSSPKPIPRQLSPPTPPKKMLKIRADGTLSSPKLRPTTNRTRQKKARSSQNRAHPQEDYVVVMKYGKRENSRILFGQKIDAILSAPPTNDTTLMHNPSGKQTKTECPKPTHPFFTGAIAHGSDQKKATVTCNAINNCQGQAIKTQTSNVNPKRMRVNSKPASQVEAPNARIELGPPNLGSDYARVTRFPGAREPVWPPTGMVRVEPLSETSESMDLQQNLVRGPHVGRKLKDAQIHTSPDEDVLRPFTDLVRNFRAGQHGLRYIDSQAQRGYSRPQRHVMTGPRLQDCISQRLIHSIKPSPSSNNQDVDELSISQSSRPPAPRCLRRVFESIATTRSAFDKFECETLNWADKYAPQLAEDVLQPGRDIIHLRDWLKTVTVSSVGLQSASSSAKATKPGGKKRKRTKEFDGFVVSSDEEANEMAEVDELDDIHPNLLGPKKTVIRAGDRNDLNSCKRTSHSVVVSGPHGCGKSAAIYAIARELGFEVFEINAGSRRSGKDILEKVGDMTKNHLVKRDVSVVSRNGEDPVNDTERFDFKVQHDLESGRQGTMNSFFQPKFASKKSSPKKLRKRASTPKKDPPEQSKRKRQSLILLEEVDVLFEDDRVFWATVLDLILESRRPVIMTCTDETLVPLDEMTLHGIFRMLPCPQYLAIDYLLLVACIEGHLLRRDEVEALYRRKGFDLRASLSELNFFCQMAVGDIKGGLEWMLLEMPSYGSDDRDHEPMRVVSEGTYCEGIGWFASEFRSFRGDGFLDGETDFMLRGQSEGLVNKESEDMECRTSASTQGENGLEGILQQLRRKDQMLEAYSSSDLFAAYELWPAHVQPLDPTQPDVTEKLRNHYTEGQRLLQADPIEDQTGSTPALAIAMRTYAQRLVSERATSLGPYPAEQDILETDFQSERSISSDAAMIKANMIAAFEPLARTSDTVLGGPKGRQISCFDGPMSVLAEDIAPYVRSIVSYDLRLEGQRRQLSAPEMQPGKENNRTRTTRASRAALEGGSKENIRRERRFPVQTNFDLVLQTGSRSWQASALAMTETSLSMRDEEHVASTTEVDML